MPMGNEHKWLLKEGVGIFSRQSCDISGDSLENTPTSHAVSLSLVMYACCDPATPLLSCTCLCKNRKWCLPSFVSPSSYTVHNCMYYSINGWVYFREKSTLCNNFIQKRGWAYFSRLRYLYTSVAVQID